MLTLERLKEMLHYDPNTGVFKRLISAGNTAVGSVAGNPNGDGYLKLNIDGNTYLCNRLAWLYMTGKWPEFQVDHHDTVKSNNRWLNLRDLPQAKNAQNRREARIDSTSGLLGVQKTRTGWTSSIQVDGKRHWLGAFKDPQSAHEKYVEAKRKLHSACTI